MSYTITPDAPGQPDTSFKVFDRGIKVATLTKQQVLDAVELDVKEGLNNIPIAWYVKRIAPGKKDHGAKMGPFFSEREAKEWIDENHVIVPLYEK
jgi:hypothetical protein